MAVYVDNFNAPFRGMVMCHLIADTQKELFEFVDKIGVQRKWVQHYNTFEEHFDISLTKKKEALLQGAVHINFRQYAIMINERKKHLRSYEFNNDNN